MFVTVTSKCHENTYNHIIMTKTMKPPCKLYGHNWGQNIFRNGTDAALCKKDP